ncbi:MAG: hypothetical protein WKG00_31160 [Polyangiaceae bacterium]
MATLSSLLVQREIASMRTVEEAIARQVIHGGDLATNLLEVTVLAEAALLPVLAEATGLEAAPPGRLPAPSAAALRAVPGELALRHGVFPLSRAADLLVLATSQPLPGPLEDDLSFALGIGLRQLVAPLVRIRQAIAEHYGQPLDRRFLRLVARLEGRADPSPSSLPPGGRAPASPGLPRPASAPPASFGSGPVPGSKYSAGSTNRTPRVGVAALPPAPIIPRAPAAPRMDLVTFAEPELAGGGVLEPSLPGAELVPAIASPAVGDALAGWAQRTARVERQRAPSRGGEGVRDSAGRLRRRGPLTAAMAENELELTSAPDAVLEVHFSFVSQFFEYAVLFVAHGDLAEGRNAAGPGADRSRVAGIGVPLDLPSILATARDRGAPMVVALAASGLDAELARDLSRVRVAARAGMVAVIPVMVRGRAVALLYGDDGEDDVELGAIGEVISFTALVEKALERAILRRKRGGGAASAPGPVLRAPPVVRAPRAGPREGAAALARALVPSAGAPQPTAIAGESAPARVSPAAESVRPAAPVFQPRAEPVSTQEDDGPEIRIEEAWDDTLGDVEDELGEELAGLADSGAPPDADRAAPAPPFETADVDEDAIEDDGDNGRDARGEVDGGPPPARADEDLGRAIARVVDASPPLPSKRAQESTAETWTGSPTAVAVLAAASTPALPSIEQHRPTLRGFAPVTQEPRPASPSGPPGTWPPRRGPAPTFERGPANAREAGEPLPTRPPANATSVPVGPIAQTAVSFSALPADVGPGAELHPSATPPPATAAAVRPRGAAPIPREEDYEVSQPSPDASEFLGVGETSAPRPPARTSETGGGLPSIIVDVGAEYASLLERVLTGGPASDEAFAELVRSGDQVLPAIAARFPGPLRVDRHRARDQLPAASQCGPILELLVAMRRVALPLVTMRSSGADSDQRFWATHALGELRYTEAANAVLPRLFDDEPSVRRVARRSAASLVSAGEPGQPILRGLEHIAGNGDEAVPRRVEAVETMGDIRAASMVPALVEAVGDPAGDVREAARRALLLVTRQDFDRDAERWNDWWLANGHRHRVDWLIDALMHEVPSIRRAAGDELKQLTKEYFGYYDDLPRRERERAQARYREWWEREGRQRFQG